MIKLPLKILLIMSVMMCHSSWAKVIADVVYTENKPNVVITKDHPSFTIQLKSNPTTGFSWFLREYNASLMMPIKHYFQIASTKLIGAPGFELWTFKVKPAAFTVPQQTIIRFIYTKPWQSSDDSTQVVFHVTTMEK